MTGTSPAAPADARVPYLLGAVLLLGWLGLGGPALRGLFVALTEVDARVHLVLGAALLAGAALRATRNGRELLAPLRAGPSARPLPLLLLVLSAVALGALPRLALPKVLLGLPLCVGSYGLLGLYQRESTLRRGLPLLLIVMLLIPFQFHLDAMFGFRARLLLAESVHRQLAWLGVPSTAVASILLLEGGVSHVDLPCSGLRSLWSGALFFLGLSWLRRCCLGLRWLFGLGALVAALLLFNLGRVFALVLLAHVLHRPELAAIVHVPLGLLGFLFSCAGASLLIPPLPAVVPEEKTSAARRLSAPAVALLGGGFFLLTLLRSTAPVPPQLVMPAVRLPPAWQLTALSPSSAETDLLARHGGVLHKWRFIAGSPAAPIAGSLLISMSQSFQAQHAPHVCLASAGLQVTGARSLPLGNVGSIAQLAIAGGQRSAVYWFQSATQTTGDVLRRTLAVLRPRAAGATGGPPPWALVSILFDDPLQPEDPLVQAQLLALHESVAATLRGTVP